MRNKSSYPPKKKQASGYVGHLTHEYPPVLGSCVGSLERTGQCGMNYLNLSAGSCHTVQVREHHCWSACEVPIPRNTTTQPA